MISFSLIGFFAIGEFLIKDLKLSVQFVDCRVGFGLIRKDRNQLTLNC